MNEIEIKKYELPKLEIKNYDQIKSFVEEENEKYKNYLVTEDTLEKDTKKRAELQKQAKAIDDRRKEIEKEISLPIKEFKEKCDVLKKMYEESADNIDKQIKIFEERLKEEKKKHCVDLYEENIDDLKSLIPFEKAFDNRWLNKTCKDTEIVNDIKNLKEKVEKGIQTIEALNSEFEVELKNTFLEDYDITRAIFKNTQLQEQKQKIEEMNQKKEEEKKEQVKQMITQKVEVVEDEEDPIKTYILKITAKNSKQKELRKFLELNEMRFERIYE